MTRDRLVFFRNGKRTELATVDPNETLLDYLRLREKRTGTKEGCNEGDCGACTVAVGRLHNGRLAYEPVNSCIQLLGQIDGADVITVDDLSEKGKAHPVQKAMVECHGSQCGFCTPGFVMTLFAHYQSGEKQDRKTVNDWLAGNLCRCTGYRPIVDAAMKSARKNRVPRSRDGLAKRIFETEKILKKESDSADLLIGNQKRFFAAPASIGSLAALCLQHPDATILSGATDVGLWITKQLRDLPQIIHTGRAKGFADIKSGKTKLVIGAGASYRDAEEKLAAIDPDIGEVIRRLGSRHIRASGTIGGNIANGSPIGDTPPMLIALGASLELLHGKKTRTLLLENFFIEYGRQDRRPGELVSKIMVPFLKKHEHFRTFKISKRFDQDISALLFAIRLGIKNGRIVTSRIAFGGMAGIPKRAKHAEAALVGNKLSDESKWKRACDAFERDFTPMDDMRASADYRMQTARNLLLKALHEISGVDSNNTRVEGVRAFSSREAAE